jgi:hypothetical protein
MNLTHQPLPQHPPAYPPPHVVTGGIDTAGPRTRVDELESRVLELLGAIAEIKTERDRAAGDAKVLTLVNDALRLDLARSDRDNRDLTDRSVKLAAELDLANKAAEEITRALCDAERENQQLRNAKSWWRLRRR